MKRILPAFAALAALATGGVAAAAPAMAASGPAQFVTHTNGHPDTTALLPGYPLPGQNATLASPGGPVWAYDNITVTLTPVPVSNLADGANYRVDVQVTGSFHGFADPNTAVALDSTGSVRGTISYYVQASQAPDGAALPATEPGGIGQPGLHDYVVQLFGGNAKIVGGGSSYTFSYQNGAYVQDTTGTHGDVKGH